MPQVAGGSCHDDHASAHRQLFISLDVVACQQLVRIAPTTGASISPTVMIAAHSARLMSMPRHAVGWRFDDGAVIAVLQMMSMIMPSDTLFDDLALSRGAVLLSHLLQARFHADDVDEILGWFHIENFAHFVADYLRLSAAASASALLRRARNYSRREADQQVVSGDQDADASSSSHPAKNRAVSRVRSRQPLLHY